MKSQVAVKTPWGSLTERITLEKLEMQGTVPAPLKASVQLDTLGKECIEKNEGLFKYKQCINITPLIMIDDVLAISNCGNDSVKMNAIIQSKIDTKQLMFGTKKCFKLHIGQKNKSTCPTLKVHGKVMETVERERYLGDILSNDSKINHNIHDRQSKGFGYVNQISSMLKEISFGLYHFNMAMLFRTTILLNGMLCSSEALYGITKAHITQLESVDNMLFKSVFQAPFSTPIAAYYLETGAIPIRYVLIGRRLMYLWTILQKNEDELVSKVFKAQKLFPVKDDFVNQITEDKEEIGLLLTESEIKFMKKTKFKNLVKEKIRVSAHSYLLEKKEKLSKLDNLTSDFNFKEYLSTDKLSISEKQLLFKLRTRMIPVKGNFSSMYKDDMSCRLCNMNLTESQEHLFSCSFLKHANEGTSVEYLDIFHPNLEKQIRAVKHWSLLLKTRTIKLNEMKLLSREARCT